MHVARDIAAPPAGAPSVHLVDLRGGRLDVAPIARLLEALDFALHPVEVWLFGSRARGEARPSSDWDLLVVVPDAVDDARLDACVGYDLARSVGVRADVLLCKVSDFIELSQTCNTIEYEVAHRGLVLRGR